jgi:putative phage-type endonuclease
MASETPAVMGLSPYQRPSDIRRIKQGGGSGFVNNAMRQGTRQEPIAREAYMRDHEPIRPAVFIDGKYGASLDGINMDLDTIWEVKTPVDGKNSERWKLAVEGKLTSYDMAQVQHQLMVTGAKRCHFCVWDVDSQTYMLTDVLPDPEFWLMLEVAWDEFWEEIALRRDKDWIQAAHVYKEAKAELQIAKEKMDYAKVRFSEILKGDCNDGAGIRVQRITVAGRTDWDKVKAHYCLDDEVLQQFKKPDSVQIRINEIKE